MTLLEAKGLTSIPVIVGGSIPDDDATRLKSMEVARVYTH